MRDKMASVMLQANAVLPVKSSSSASHSRPTLAWAPPATDENGYCEELNVGCKVIFVGHNNIARGLDLDSERHGEVVAKEADRVQVVFGNGKEAWMPRLHVQKAQASAPSSCRAALPPCSSGLLSPLSCGSVSTCCSPSLCPESVQSSLSRFFVEKRDLLVPEARCDASLADVVDSAARSMHLSSQKHKPDVNALLEGLSAADRQETLVWVVQAFDVMHFNDSLLFDTALILDRYYAALPREDNRTGGTQRKLLAAVCMALKTGAPVDTQLSLRDLIKHLGRDSVPFDEVLSAEIIMLRKLRFHISTPSAREFLEALMTRLNTGRMQGACRSLAEFLMQLTLVDANLHYRFPHAVLAGACIALALHAMPADMQVPLSSYTVLMEDVALHCPEAFGPHNLLMQAVFALHAHWLRCMTAGNEQSAYARHLCNKFNRIPHYGVGTWQPTPAPPTQLPPATAWVQPVQTAAAAASSERAPERLQERQPEQRLQQQPRSQERPQDEIDEAILVVRQSLMADQHSLDTRATHSSRCPRCGRSRAPHAEQCIECGYDMNGVEDANWATTLAHRLRGPADGSWKVRGVLAQHNWTNGRFRRSPDRELLLRDLQRAAQRPSSASMPTTTAGSMSGRSGSSISVTADKVRLHRSSCSGSSGSITANLDHHQQRRRRAASWAGMRSAAVVSAAAAAGGSAAMCCNAPTRAQPSRSPR